MLVIGIDPGKSGGIAWDDGFALPQAVKMPETEMDVTQFLRELCRGNTEECFVYLERVGSFPGDSGASMFSFGRGYGYLLGTLAAIGVPCTTVTPMAWKKALSVLPAKKKIKESASDEQRRLHRYEHKKKLKAASKDTAQKLYPHLIVTHMTSEALLIMRYGQIKIGDAHGHATGEGDW